MGRSVVDFAGDPLRPALRRLAGLVSSHGIAHNTTNRVQWAGCLYLPASPLDSQLALLPPHTGRRPRPSTCLLKEALALSAGMQVGWNRKKRRLHEFVAFIGVVAGSLVPLAGHHLRSAFCHAAGVVQTFWLDEDAAQAVPPRLHHRKLPSPSGPERYRLIRLLALPWQHPHCPLHVRTNRNG